MNDHFPSGIPPTARQLAESAYQLHQRLDGLVVGMRLLEQRVVELEAAAAEKVERDALTPDELRTVEEAEAAVELDQFECDHVWLLRVESDTSVCAMCDAEELRA